MDNFELEKNFNPAWLERMQQIIPKNEWEKFLESCLIPLPKTIRVRTNEKIPKNWKTKTVAEISEAFFLEQTENIPFGKTLPYFCGHIYPMSLSSFLPVLVLNPNTNETILDLCASPGSKTTFISDRMKNKGVLIANEPDGKRIKALEENVRRMGSMNTIITQVDGSAISNFFGEEIDKILVDAPCSSDGFGRRDPKFYTQTWSERNLPGIINLQKKLITTAFSILREEGELVYSTCTANPEENEGVVQYLLEQCPTAEILPIDLGTIPAQKGVPYFMNKKFEQKITENVRRMYPHIKTKDWDSEFFFVAKIKKKKLQQREFYYQNFNSFLEPLKKNRQAEIMAIFRKTFGIPNEIWEEYRFSEDQNNIFALSKEAIPFLTKIKFKKAGMLIFNREKGISTEFAIQFGKYATKNIWKLNEIEKNKFLGGYDLELEKNTTWQHGEEIIVQFENYSIGYGKVVNGKLKNKLETRLAMR